MERRPPPEWGCDYKALPDAPAAGSPRPLCNPREPPLTSTMSSASPNLQVWLLLTCRRPRGRSRGEARGAGRVARPGGPGLGTLWTQIEEAAELGPQPVHDCKEEGKTQGFACLFLCVFVSLFLQSSALVPAGSRMDVGFWSSTRLPELCSGSSRGRLPP